MASKKKKHWTAESSEKMASRVASDFLAQIEEKIAEADWSHTDLAEALGVTKGRVSQVFNNPGNLTLKTMLNLAEAAQMLISVVAYEKTEREDLHGPVSSYIFEACWEKLGRPDNHWVIEETTVAPHVDLQVTDEIEGVQAAYYPPSDQADDNEAPTTQWNLDPAYTAAAGF